MTRSTTRSSGPGGAKKTSSGSTGATKAPARKRTSKASESNDSTSEESDEGSRDSSSTGSASSRKQAPRAQARPPARPSKVAAEAAGELLELTGKQAEGITGIERTDDGWVVQVEVVEVRRIPDTTDVLALYEVTTDPQGAMLGYHRVRRYARGVPGND